MLGMRLSLQKYLGMTENSEGRGQSRLGSDIRFVSQGKYKALYAN